MRRWQPAGLIAAAAALSSVLTACAVADQSQPEIIKAAQPEARPSAVSRPATPTSAIIQVYFVDPSNHVKAVFRSDPAAGLSTDIAALLAGPTGQESADGLTSAVPVGTSLDSVHQSGSTAILDFTDQLASVSGHEQLLAFAQIVLTADSLPDVERVQITIAGQPVNAPEPNGTLAPGPVTKADYASLVSP